MSEATVINQSNRVDASTTNDDATKAEDDSVNQQNNEIQVETSQNEKKGFSFWIIIVSLLLATFLSALDLTAISTALPTSKKTHFKFRVMVLIFFF